MPKQLAFIHTSPSVIPTFKSLADELIGPRAKVFNIVDESLLCDIIGHGCCPTLAPRISRMIWRIGCSVSTWRTSAGLHTTR